jgi:biotin-(acetyl-CoA carboxylase) ligase
VTSGSQVFLKWPNDVLIDEKKVCGVLIEIEGDFMLVGIGCNVMTAPDVQSTGEDNGRPSTCLANHMQNCAIEDSGNKDTCSSNVPLDEIHKEIAAEIYGALSSYTKQSSDSAADVITDFEKYMNFNPQKLRSASTAGDEVTPVRVNTDGTLQVYFIAVAIVLN